VEEGLIIVHGLGIYGALEGREARDLVKSQFAKWERQINRAAERWTFA
jgi:hypothetical protein